MGRRTVCLLLFLLGCQGATLRSSGGENPPAWAKAPAEDRRRLFLAEYGVELELVAEQRTVALGEDIPLRLLIRNLGSRQLTFLTRRRTAFWPFGHVERAKVRVETERRAISQASGQHRVRSTVAVEDLEDLVVGPGQEVGIEAVIPSPGGFAGHVEYIQVQAQASFYPLAVQTPGEPERFLVLNFPAVLVHWVPRPLVLQRDLEELDGLDRAVEEHSEELVARAAILAGGGHRVATADRLIALLPGPDTLAARRLIRALELVTGLSHGGRVSNWRGWWESQAGARWALQARSSQGLRPRGE